MKEVIAPGKTIGILGGGQLGRMGAQAATDMGYRVHIFAPEKDSPAFEIASAYTIGDYSDETALSHFAQQVDVVTCEFENVPSSCLEHLSRFIPVRPGASVFSICQHRIREKDFLSSIGVPVAPYRSVTTKKELTQAIAAIGVPSILKTVSFGYDGKGQARIGHDIDIDMVWNKLGNHPSILEGFIDFKKEISVIVARNPNGTIAHYEPAENQHQNHILHTSFVPARITENVLLKAEAIAKHIALEMQLEGLLAVEMFVTKDDEVLVNELAPRPHNSGHWSMDAAITSQFEQLIRAICNLPLGATDRLCDASMINLLGDDIAQWSQYLSEPKTKLHLYGKNEARAGRKMGHITRLMPRS